MADYYVDPAATGANDGSSWTDAWTDVQTAFNTVTAGNTCYCRGTQTLTATIDVDTQTGSDSAGFIKFVGCNASGNVDGTRFVLNGNSYVVNCINIVNVSDYYYLQNFEFKNATSSNFFSNSHSSNYWVVENCLSHSSGLHGFNISRLLYSIFIGCIARDNTGDGFNVGIASVDGLFFCSAFDNGVDGYKISRVVITLGCLSFNNGQVGFNDVGNAFGQTMFSCVSNNNGHSGIKLSTSGRVAVVLGCRSTNHTSLVAGRGMGLDGNAKYVFEGFNYFENNENGNVENLTLGRHYIDARGRSTNTSQEDQSNTNQGYMDLTAGSENFNLRDDATLRRVEITLPGE